VIHYQSQNKKINNRLIIIKADNRRNCDDKRIDSIIIETNSSMDREGLLQSATYVLKSAIKITVTVQLQFQRNTVTLMYTMQLQYNYSYISTTIRSTTKMQ